MARQIAAATILCLSLAACGDGAPPAADGATAADAAAVAADGPGVGVDSNGLRLSANSAAPSAAYLVLSGDGQPMTLTGVSSTQASRIELHESVRENGMVSMRAVDRLEIPADGQVAMRPGGLHLMIFDISQSARAAGVIPLELTFANGTRVTINASTGDLTAQASGAPADHQAHSGH